MKKNMKINLLTSTLFIFSIAVAPLLLAVSAAADETVLDLDGKELQTNTDYFIIPGNSQRRGGGLVLAQRNNTCPFYVTQEKHFEVSSNGLPLKFLPVEPKDKFVKISTDMNIVFSAATVCAESTVWRLGALDEVARKRYVTTGAAIGNPGIGTVSNWFKIDKNENYKNGNYYKLVFCPGVCNSCKVICGDVSVFIQNGKRWLGLSDGLIDLPITVMFKKA